MNRDPHEITPECQAVHCHWHNVDESAEDGAFIWCFECGHVYRTARDLRRAYRRKAWKLWRADWTGDFPKTRPPALGFGPVSRWALLRQAVRILMVRAKRITFCQECSHDF